MRVKRVINLLSGLLGFAFLIASLSKIQITGAVIGTNLVSIFLGLFGIAIIVVALIIEKKEFRNKKEN